MKKVKFAVSCLLLLSGVIGTKTPSREHKQYMKHLVQQINALNKKADAIIQQRDRLTAHLRSEQKKQRRKSS